jgi:hypothetical protein
VTGADTQYKNMNYHPPFVLLLHPLSHLIGSRTSTREALIKRTTPGISTLSRVIDYTNLIGEALIKTTTIGIPNLDKFVMSVLPRTSIKR